MTVEVAEADTLAAVREALSVVMEQDVHAHDAGSRLTDIGADSLVLVSVADVLEERFRSAGRSIHIDDAALGCAETVGDLASYLHSLLG